MMLIRAGVLFGAALLLAACGSRASYYYDRVHDRGGPGAAVFTGEPYVAPPEAAKAAPREVALARPRRTKVRRAHAKPRAAEPIVTGSVPGRSTSTTSPIPKQGTPEWERMQTETERKERALKARMNSICNGC